MGSRITRQNPNVHSNAFVGQAHEPFHRRPNEVRAARGRIDLGADAAADRAALAVFVVAINVRAMVLVLFRDRKAPVGVVCPRLPEEIGLSIAI